MYDPTFGKLEIKCIESGKGMTPLETYLAKRCPESGKKKEFCLLYEQNKLKLDQNHNYFKQIDGQNAVSGLTRCDFVLMTDLSLWDDGVHVQRIFFNDSCFKDCLPTLTDFYFKHLLPRPVSNKTV